MLVNFYLSYIVPLSVLIPVFTALLGYRCLTKSAKIILWFIIGSAIINLINIIWIELHGTGQLMFHIYGIFEFILLSWFYSTFFEKRGRNVVLIIAGLFTVACIINLLFIQKQDQFNAYTRSLGALLLIAYTLIVSYRQGNVDSKLSWADDYHNWFTTGILLYYCSSIFMFVFFNYWSNASRALSQGIWIAHDTVLILEYILFAIGFYKCKVHQTI